jgi:hypothetical protein
MMIWDYATVLGELGHTGTIINTPDRSEIIEELKEEEFDIVHLHYDVFHDIIPEILNTISPKLYGWYHENTSSCGNSTYTAIEAFSKIKITPDYLNSNKNVSLVKNVTLHSGELGITKFKCKSPFFTAPYGCASEYGGKSNEISTMLGTIKAGGIYTFACLTEYNLEYLVNIFKKNNKDLKPFYMFQLYLTGDNDINISLIERAKVCDVSVIMITIDTGSNNHGGIGLLENQSDLTFQRNFCGNLFHDPVFNIKSEAYANRIPKIHHAVTRNLGAKYSM